MVERRPETTIKPPDRIERSGASPSHFRRFLRKLIHRLSYHFVLRRKRTTVVRAAGFRLTVHPTVFHPKYFLTSKFFADFIGHHDWTGKRVADVGTGSGILALAAARAGAAYVLAMDINPSAAAAASENAIANGLRSRVGGVCSDLLASIAPRPYFDVILSSPPSFPGQPLDLADRAWHAGEDYRDIASLFQQVRDRLAPEGRFYLLLSSDSDVGYFEFLARAAGFCWHLVAKRSILIESFLIYELQTQEAQKALCGVQPAQ